MFFGHRFFVAFFRFFVILARFWETPGAQKINKKSKKTNKIATIRKKSDLGTGSARREASGRVSGGFWEGLGRIFKGFREGFGRVLGEFWGRFFEPKANMHLQNVV